MRRVSTVVLFVFVASVLRAQSTTASLTGRITDPSNAMIADAKVAAIRSGNNFRYETTTNGSGEYCCTSLASARTIRANWGSPSNAR